MEYRWRTAHLPGARFAPAAFASGSLDPAVNLAGAAAARLHVFDDAGRLPHVEHPESFLDALGDALSRAQK